jgi:hypothetical protein
VLGKRRLRQLKAQVDHLEGVVKASKVLLAHARREELTDGALRRALREAIETERRVSEDEWVLEWDPDWEAFMQDPEYGSLVRDLAWELLMRALHDQRPPNLEEAERLLRESVEEFGINTIRGAADELGSQLRRDWSDDIAHERERVESADIRFGTRQELDEESLRRLKREGATSPRAVHDLEGEMLMWFGPLPVAGGRPESLEQLKERMHARAEELGLGSVDVKLLEDWVRVIGPSMIAGG